MLCLKIADFGFARQYGGTDDMFTSVLGSPLYMAPELAAGRADPRIVDATKSG